MKIIIDGIEVELGDAGIAQIVRTALDKRDARIDALSTDAKARTTELERAQARADAAEASLAEAQRKADEADKPDVVADTLAVIRVLDDAGRIVELDGKRRDELLGLTGEGDLPSRIRRSVVLQALPAEAANLKTRGDAYIEGRFEALLAARPSSSSSSSRQAAEVIATAGARGRTDEDEGELDLSRVLDSYDPLDVILAGREPESKHIVRA